MIFIIYKSILPVCGYNKLWVFEVCIKSRRAFNFFCMSEYTVVDSTIEKASTYWIAKFCDLRELSTFMPKMRWSAREYFEVFWSDITSKRCYTCIVRTIFRSLYNLKSRAWTIIIKHLSIDDSNMFKKNIYAFLFQTTSGSNCAVVVVV